MDRARQRNLCRILVVNKIDHEGIDLEGCREIAATTFGTECLPINLPAKNGSTRRRLLLPAERRKRFLVASSDAHQHIIDQVVEINETVMGHYLDDGEVGLSGQELHDAFEQCLREGHLVPICFTSGAHRRRCKRTAGRSPRSSCRIRRKAIRRSSSRAPARTRSRSTRVPDPKKHVIADVFKIVNDPFVGKLSVFRVHQGTVTKDTQLFIDDSKKPFKVGHLFQLQGKDHIEIDQAIPGDIAAVAKIEEIHFDAVLHDSHDEDQIHLKPLDFPMPMFGLAVEPEHKGEEQKLATRCTKLGEEDPCFRVEHNKELNESVIRGLSATCT